jgi:ribosomal protection tetracycline resistance protein
VSRKTLNLGILAHVDAGKTTLTERLLYAAGVIDEIGSVDDGTTQTDSLALEQQRGITIKSAVVSFAIDDVTVNLIDTPGHPDFIAEVERVLAVLDGVVLVVSAVEGVQAQTPLLMRALQRLHVPTLVFVNKIDRGGADCERVLTGISQRLAPAIVPMGSARAVGTRAAEFAPWGAADAAFTAGLVSVLAEHDDGLLAAYVNDEAGVPYRRLREELAAQTKRALVHPVFFGSAITGAGIGSLMSAIAELLPANAGDVDGPLSGAVFKVERGRSGEKIAYVRLFSGTLRTRDRVRERGEHEQKVTAISVFEDGSVVRRSSVAAGQIAQLWGLGEGQIGDAVGLRRGTAAARSFPPPTLETVVLPRDQDDKAALHAALTQVAEQDPLINLRQDDLRHELFLSIYGEVQKEVIQATLANDFGLEVEFRETTTICIERPTATGAAAERLREGPNPFLATVGLRIDPAASGSGVTFVRAREVLGTMPLAFFRAVEDTVHRTLHQGIHGWQVTDCTVTMTHSGYLARHSHAHQGFAKEMSSTGEDFRGLTPLVLMSALKQAGTVVCEPIHRFRLEFPSDVLAALWPALGRLGAVAQTPTMQGSTGILEGEIQAARMHELQLELRALTRGEGVLELAFDRYEPVRGAAPARPRTDRNPLNRKEYLLHVARRLPGG